MDAFTVKGCAFRGHDETSNSRNRGYFLELITLLASYNDKVSKVILDNAPRNAKYTYHMIQKEILHILANKVCHKICEDIADSKFCIIIDEARDESRREQMAIVLRYVDEKRFIKERFFDLLELVAASRELQVAQAIEIANMLAIDELETGKGFNQIGIVKRAGEIRWSPHFSFFFVA
ncbi:General transcription factor 2-related zinc finger protein [Gossypium australe]|uniref:General transcription factor 2-related zinc finger protein n=1 Tax=Gossypium australe TaxID=47621 RepID=A0A5B6VKG7_9ROSI|nr:General transcription factor 2-related zinc finger protein [Gossypium australe]